MWQKKKCAQLEASIRKNLLKEIDRGQLLKLYYGDYYVQFIEPFQVAKEAVKKQQQQKVMMLRQNEPNSSNSEMSLQDQIQDLSIHPRKNKPQRTIDDFLDFVNIVLAYTNYPNAFDENNEDRKLIESPLNSIGESARGSANSCTSSSPSSFGDQEINEPGDVDKGKNEESWGMVTCWCGKPFAGRPMIECESCLIWIHLSCARVRKSNIPKHFKCSRCKPRTPRRKRTASGNLGDYEGMGSQNSSGSGEQLSNGNYMKDGHPEGGFGLNESTSPSSSNSAHHHPHSQGGGGGGGGGGSQGQQRGPIRGTINKKRKPNGSSKAVPKSPKKISTIQRHKTPSGRKSYNSMMGSGEAGDNPSLPLRLTFSTVGANVGESSS